MELTPHFTLAEFIASDTAARLGIDNSLPDVLMPAAKATCEMLERIRVYLSGHAGKEVAIQVTSGYRCAELNKAIGSSATSDHIRALAIDFKAPTFGTPYDVSLALSAAIDELGIGQLIHEYGVWTHVSTRRPERELNRVITISKAMLVTGIQRV